MSCFETITHFSLPGASWKVHTLLHQGTIYLLNVSLLITSSIPPGPEHLLHPAPGQEVSTASDRLYQGMSCVVCGTKVPKYIWYCLRYPGTQVCLVLSEVPRYPGVSCIALGTQVPRYILYCLRYPGTQVCFVLPEVPRYPGMFCIAWGTQVPRYILYYMMDIVMFCTKYW